MTEQQGHYDHEHGFPSDIFKHLLMHLPTYSVGHRVTNGPLVSHWSWLSQCYLRAMVSTHVRHCVPKDMVND